MPIKYKPSETRIDPTTKLKYNVHHYISHVSTQTLLEDLNKVSTTRKQKDKIRKELTRRGV